jgi:antibiotic biosynthesis monooxygenase (ABM) superfamily enzyme
VKKRKESQMAVRVLITRRFKKDCVKHGFKLLNELRGYVTIQPGYISGETLIASEDPDKLLVISTWSGRKKWLDWLDNSKRAEYSEKMRALLDGPEQVEVFLSGEKMPEWVHMA